MSVIEKNDFVYLWSKCEIEIPGRHGSISSVPGFLLRVLIIFSHSGLTPMYIIQTRKVSLSKWSNVARKCWNQVCSQWLVTKSWALSILQLFLYHLTWSFAPLNLKKTENFLHALSLVFGLPTFVYNHILLVRNRMSASHWDKFHYLTKCVFLSLSAYFCNNFILFYLVC